MTCLLEDKMRLLYDIETDGLLDTCTKIHCLVIKDLDTRQRWSLHGDQIDEGLRLLEKAEVRYGHNILAFDEQAVRKLKPWWNPRGKSVDTLICARLIWTDIEQDDFRLRRRRPSFPAAAIGSHSLEAWGHRLGVLKGSFGKTSDWREWSPAMQRYCEQDVEVLEALVRLIEKQNYSPEAIELEHRFAEIILKMTAHGVAFDRDAAVKLYQKLAARRADLEKQLQEVFPPRVVEMKTPAYWTGVVHDRSEPGDPSPPVVRFPTKEAAVKAGAVCITRGPNKTKTIPFNPGSRKQIAERLMELGWKPEKFTDHPTNPQPQIDEAVLESLPYPQAKPLAEFFLIQKRIGQLAEGANAWLKLERNGRIHGEVITNGAVTGRCAHINPNMAQVPRVGSPYGEECRSLFTASPGKVLVGADASGLELRTLAHYLSPYDGGAYIKIVTEGDVHTSNQRAFGLPEGKQYRAPAKNGIYCKIYGGGDLKLGKTLYPVDLFGPKTDQEYAELGRKAREAVDKNIVGFGELTEAIAKVAFGPIVGWRHGRNGKRYPIRDRKRGRGWLRGLDGRRLRLRSEHSALNTLFQSAGAVLVKMATVIWYDKLTALGLKWVDDFALVLHVHDEIQAEADPEHAETVGKAFIEAIAEAGRKLGFRCPLTGEYKIGANWAQTH